jgi:POT family proton-dependent oligopeptide transporter
MRAILLLFMIAPLAVGGMGMDQKLAAQIYGNYTMASYLVCILGGYLADNFIGARRAVLVGGLIITAGHYALAFATVPTFYAGLVLVALGTGLLKPSISTLVGGLYSHGDARRDAGFSLFYMGINLGAFAAPLVVGWLAQGEQFKAMLAGWGLDPAHSWHWGFGAAGVGMTFGMIVYLRHRHWLAHVGHPPAADLPRPWGRLALVAAGTAALLAVMIASDYVPWINPLVYALPVVGVIWFGVVRKDADSRRLAAILVFFICAILFWAVFEQAGSSLTLFADELTRNELSGFAFPSAWFQSVNSLFILALAPLFAWGWVRLRERQPSMPMKFVWGLALLGLSYALLVPAARLTAEGKVSPWWLVAVYFLQTLGELCLSPVGLSAMTKLAPARLTGLVMGVWFLGTALGNKLAGVVAADFNAQDPQALAHFFWQQALMVAGLTALLLVLVPWVRRLTGETPPA